MQRSTHKIDATNRVLGRLASEIAQLLRGKHKPDFMPNKDTGDFVIVQNAAKIRLTGKKIRKKKYFHHTGYLGSLKETPLRKLFEQSPDTVLKRAVFGMLPKNKLRSRQIKRLKFE